MPAFPEQERLKVLTVLVSSNFSFSRQGLRPKKSWGLMLRKGGFGEARVAGSQ